MHLFGVEFLDSLVRQGGFSAKMVLNKSGAIFLPVHLQHRDLKGPGVSYEDDYAGNALAAMLSPGRIEIRYHRDFPDARVARIIRILTAEPRLTFLAGWEVRYQGRLLTPAS